METDTKLLETLRDQERAARTLLLELAQKRRQIMKRLHDAGMSYQAIANIYGVRSRERVRQIIESGEK